MLKKIARSVAWILVACAASTAGAQYPDKVITMIVPFAGGGPTDTIARILAQAMSAALKQRIVIENVGGAGGTIGAARVAQSAPDGYTLLVHHIGHSVASALYRKLPYDPIADFEPIGLINDGAQTFVARDDFPASNFKEYLDYIKANKDRVNMANAGIGSASHLCGLLFMSSIETEVMTIPYKGTGPAMNDLLGGAVDIMCDQSANAISHIKSGKIKVYAVTLPNRLASLRDVPTAAEAGLAGFSISVWHALYAPKDTPQPIIEQLTVALQTALKDANLKQRYSDLGAEAVSENRATPEALTRQLKSEIDRWEPIIKKIKGYAG
ncbi:MAG: tripartite tricarboxylate transporter substrate binding protein BugD [Candidatus Accumulibacter sp.]|jgi:tripartite-type tricarboxylate transporter receptor subunit TctC|nr:tripartite tricarboxylate transporter substrate binding protein BugD [Accumulibacter sp.]